METALLIIDAPAAMKSLASHLAPALLQVTLLMLFLNGSVPEVLRVSTTLLVASALCFAVYNGEGLITVAFLIASFMISRCFKQNRSSDTRKAHPMTLKLVDDGIRSPCFFLIDDSGKRFRLQDSQVASLERQIAVLLAFRGYPKATLDCPLSKAEFTSVPKLHLPAMSRLGERKVQ